MSFSNLSFLVDPGNSTRTIPDAGTQWGRSRRWVDFTDASLCRLCVGGQVTSPTGVGATVSGGLEYSLDNQVTWTQWTNAPVFTIGDTAKTVITDWFPIDPAVTQAECWIRSWYQAGGPNAASVVIALQFLDLQFR